MKVYKTESGIAMDPIERVLLEMEQNDPESDEYDKQLNRLERLVRLKHEQKGGVDPNTLVTTAGGIISILIIVAYEQKHVLVSKAFQIAQRAIRH